MGNTSKYIAQLSKREEMQGKKETLLHLLQHRETLLLIIAQGEASLRDIDSAIRQAQSIPGADQARMWKTRAEVTGSLCALKEKDLQLETHIHHLSIETNTAVLA